MTNPTLCLLSKALQNLAAVFEVSNLPTPHISEVEMQCEANHSLVVDGGGKENVGPPPIGSRGFPVGFQVISPPPSSPDMHTAPFPQLHKVRPCTNLLVCQNVPFKPDEARPMPACLEVKS